MVPLGGHPEAESQSRGHGRLPVCLRLRHICQQLVPYLVDRRQRYLPSCIPPCLNQLFQTHILNIRDDLALCKVIDGYLDVGVEINYGHDGVWPLTFDCTDILGYPHFNDLFP